VLPNDPNTASFTGDLNLTVRPRDVGSLGAGIERTDDDKSSANLLGLHASRVEREIGPSQHRVAAIFELHGPTISSE
jgi:hypothetical protein